MNARNPLTSRIEITHSFNGCRLLENSFLFSNMDVTFSFTGKQRPPTMSDNEYIVTLTVAYHRLCCWMEYFLNDIFIIGVDDMPTLPLFGNTTLKNSFMITPYMPSNDVICQLLHSKIRTICNGDLLVGELKLTTDNENATFFFNPSSEEDYTLPTQDKFMGKKSLHSVPWWKRYDCDMYDTVVDSASERKKILAQLEPTRFFDEVEKSILTTTDNFPDDTPPTKNKKSTWVPTLVK